MTSLVVGKTQYLYVNFMSRSPFLSLFIGHVQQVIWRPLYVKINGIDKEEGGHGYNFSVC